MEPHPDEVARAICCFLRPVGRVEGAELARNGIRGAAVLRGRNEPEALKDEVTLVECGVRGEGELS